MQNDAILNFVDHSADTAGTIGTISFGSNHKTL